MIALQRVSARSLLVVSAAAGMVIAIWLTAQLAGWDENRVLDWIPESTVLAAFVIGGLLVADTVLPIPATILMLASGALFGPVGGAVVNGVGLFGAAAAGYALGQYWPAIPDRLRNERSVRPVVIAATRGVPVLGESFAIGAGVVGAPLGRFLPAAGVGAVVVGAVYAVAGSVATDHWSLLLVAFALAASSFVVAKTIASKAKAQA